MFTRINPVRLTLASIALSLTISGLGCSNYRGQTVTDDNQSKIESGIPQSGLSDDERKALLDAFARSKDGNYDPDGKTVGTIIQEQKAYQEKQDADALAAHEAQVKAEHEAAVRAQMLLSAMTLHPVRRELHKADTDSGQFDDQVEIFFQFHNTGNKAISGFSGTVHFTSAFGESISDLDVESDPVNGKSAPPNASGETSWVWSVNPFISSWKQFMSLDLSQMKATWQPKEIIFADGSRLKAEDSSS